MPAYVKCVLVTLLESLLAGQLGGNRFPGVVGEVFLAGGAWGNQIDYAMASLG
jgi:hypothetical protein